ncbi:MAG: 3'-5' exonuclease domain-containing protein 2 [Paludibacteraceae bacterium]|nr:3'-5' exonuclease domain-containing protein 2 [Paludibacteraceae bacterium]
MSDKHPLHISKEQVQEMPLAIFDGETIVVEHLSQVPEAMRYLNRQRVVGVDTETRPAFRKGEHYPVALLQIATLKRCYLFRLHLLGLPDSLASFFANSRITKVGLAFRDDLAALRQRTPFEPDNCVDVQSMVCRYGIFELGLQKLFALLFGKRVSKSQRLTNWENLALTPEQARYAATDAWATLLIYKKLCGMKPLTKREVENLKREEHERQLQHQQEVIMGSENALNNKHRTRE